MASNKTVSNKRVIIVGAGIGGLTFAVGLKRQLGFENFTIFEMGEDVGGTWHDNTYPGCASDVPTHWYCLSTDLNPYWPQTHVLQPQIESYWQKVSQKYDLYPRCVFHTAVTSAEWDPEEQLYHVTVRDVHSGATRVEVAHVLVSAIGILCVPHYAEGLKGVEGFKGVQFHSARWNHNVSLHDKRVAVIGNGCSAAQFIPIISEDPTTQITNICRSPNWVMPTHRAKYSALQQWVFAHVPLVLKIHRSMAMVKQEVAYMALLTGKIGRKSFLREYATEDIRKYIRKTAPEEYHDVLIPNYPAGCKRVVIDSGYLKSLHRPNVSLTYEGIAEITENSIVTKKGDEIPVDVIIHATGFASDKFPLEIRGSNGRSLQDYFREKGGPTAYLGTTVPGFPNFYTLAGPNTATGHGSVIFTEEVQTNYMIQLIKPVLQDKVTSFEVTDRASDEYNTEIQRRLSTSVWSSCTSWYRVGHEGKISNIFPGSLMEMWWRLRSPKWNDFKVAGAKPGGWSPRRRLGKVVQGFGMVCIVAAMLVLGSTRTNSWPASIVLPLLVKVRELANTGLRW